MTRVRAFRVGLLLTLLLGLSPEALGSPESAASDAAQSWLTLLDRGEWAESWVQASSLFRGAIDRETWRQQVSAVRRPLGQLQSRELISAQYAESLPGAPDGRYVVIQYRTRFSKKEQAIETITPAYEDGRWRVSGYYVR